MTLSAVALDLLQLLQEREIPASKCDLKPKNELTRAGFAERKTFLTNSRHNIRGPEFTRVCLVITDEGRKFLDEN